MPVLTPELIARHAQAAQAEPRPTLGAMGDRNHDRLHKIGHPAVVAGNIMDLATTVQAIREGRAREANPLMRGSTGKMVAVKAATTAAEVYLLEQLAKKHPKAAFVAALTLGGIGAGLAAHNSRVGKK